jgi:hypothetical protein
MSRTTIAVTVVSFLVLAFALAHVAAILGSRPTDGYSLASEAVRALGTFAIAAVIPLIIWAFLRFDRRSALVPITIWGGLVGLIAGGGIVASNLKPILSSALEIPSVKQGFKSGLIPSATKSCVSSMRAAKPATVSDAQIEAYCTCSVTAIADGLSADEFGDILRDAKNVPAEVRAKMETLAATCRSQLHQPAP